MRDDGVERRPILLIVDDEAQILSALKRSLRREDYEIVAVESAVAALRVLRERHVDVILSDHKMPGVSGVQLLRRAAELRPALIRILITGWTEEIPQKELERLGIYALISKPWDDSRLKSDLRGAMVVARKSSPERGDSDTRDRSSGYSSPR